MCKFQSNGPKCISLTLLTNTKSRKENKEKKRNRMALEFPENEIGTKKQAQLFDPRRTTLELY